MPNRVFRQATIIDRLSCFFLLLNAILRQGNGSQQLLPLPQNSFISPKTAKNMHSVDLLEEALDLARSAGFEVRDQWLGESRGGACRVGSKWILFVNLSLTAEEQLQGLIVDLRRSQLPLVLDGCSSKLRRLLRVESAVIG
jgi:hypothetical protein